MEDHVASVQGALVHVELRVLVVMAVLDVVAVLDVEDLALEIAIRHVRMDAHQGVLKTAVDVEQVALEDAEEIALVPVEAIVQEDAVMAARQVVEEVVRVVVPDVRAAMVLVLDHVAEDVQDNVEDVVIIVPLVVLPIVALRVLELAMVAFQIQFNKLI